jgi:molybdopterin-guanine dinucleotide biosynthesis protein A
MTTLPISGYVLAGGRSSRMGTDKALLELAGQPLIAHAVAKLRHICAGVHILSSNPALAAYAPLVPDLHPNCGPVGGIEAALAHSAHDWNLILAVDLPFLPSAVLYRWAKRIIAPTETNRVAMFTADGRPQPAACLLHRQIAPSIAAAVALEELKLLPVLEAAAHVLALQQDQPLDKLLSLTKPGAPHAEMWVDVTAAQRVTQHLWFTNLNTPLDFAVAEANTAALDTAGSEIS